MLGIVACRISCLAGYLILLVFPVRRYKESAAAEIERDRRVVGHAAALGDAYATLTRGDSGLQQSTHVIVFGSTEMSPGHSFGTVF